MSRINQVYQQLLKDILTRGFTYEDPNRKGVKRKQLTDYRIKYNLMKEGFPLLSLRKIHYKGGIGEFVSFVNGHNNIVDLQENGVNFWYKDGYNYYKKSIKNPISFEEYVRRVKDGDRALGDLGKIYPYQMRNWDNKVDQIEELIKTLKTNPMATKKTVTMWNPSDMEETSLSCCHWSFEILTEVLSIREREDYLKNADAEIYDSYLNDFKFNDREKALDEIGIPKYGLSVKWHQHSVDVFLGLPTNFIYYACMCIFLACEVNMLPKDLIADLSNVHLYDNAIKPAYELLSRNPNKFKAPKFFYNNNTEKLSVENFKIEEYESYENIKVEMLAYNN